MIVEKNIVCECHSLEHMLQFSYFSDDPDTLYIMFHLDKFNFWKRLVTGIKYIFGYQSQFGSFDETLIYKDKAIEIRDMMDKFIKDNESSIKRS